jgi:hypothetical protein
METITKRTVPKQTTSLVGVGEIKMTTEGLIIQGFANKAVVDRGNDIIAVDAWELKNFESNPVILYNHGFDPQLGSTPVGKALQVKPTPQGLWVKAQLSSMDDPLINRIRGLVQEKILRAFSVGFNAIDQLTDAKTGVKTITKAELFEISIVGVPMNQDSLFEVTGKMLKSMDPDALRHDILTRKGAWVAAAIHNAMYEKQKTEKLSRDDILEAMAEKADLEEGALMDILAGNITPVPEAVLAAASELLGLDLAALTKLDAGDKEVEDAASQAEQAKPEEEVPAEADQAAEAPGAAEGGKAGGADNGSAAAGDAGKDEAVSTASAFQDCVASSIAKLMQEGKDQNAAVAEAISGCSEGKCQKPSRAEYAKWFKLADSISMQIKQADQGVTQPPTTEITVDRTDAAEADNGNPYLHAQMQTNVLLGQVVAELQALQKAVISLQAFEVVESQGEEDAMAPMAEGEDASKSAANGIPEAGMSPEDLKAAQEMRVKEFGIEALADAALTFAESGPQDLAKYGDPVNILYAIDTAEAADAARVAFKKDAAQYKEDSSKAAIHDRIMSAQLEYGSKAEYDEQDPLDGLLSQPIKDKLINSNQKKLDSTRKRLENMKARLCALEVG